MRLCEDCWYYYVERGICLNRSISEIDYTTGTPISLAFDLRDKNKLGKCGKEGTHWRPKTYSPNKEYRFQVECPDCKKTFVYDLYLEDSGKRKCKKCNKELWLPGYGTNHTSKKLLHSLFQQPFRRNNE